MFLEFVSFVSQRYELKSSRDDFCVLCFVLSGNGSHKVGIYHGVYYPHKLFIIKGNERHIFTNDTKTEFLLVRFYANYFDESSVLSQVRLHFLVHYCNQIPLSLLQTTADKRHVAEIFKMILLEIQVGKTFYYQSDLIGQLVGVVLTIAFRTVFQFPAIRPSKTFQAIELLNYIHSNVHSPNSLNSSVMAECFNCSTVYIGEYFRNHIGQSLQEYRQNYRMKLVALSLLYTDKQINELVYEYGFTDASHLHKVFKKHKGMSPSLFRKIGKMNDIDF